MLDTWTARNRPYRVGDLRERRFSPYLPYVLSRILSPNFLWCYRIYKPIRIRVLRSYFDDFRGYYKGVILYVHKKLLIMKKWTTRGRLSIFSSRIFRFFPTILDLLEHKVKRKNTIEQSAWKIMDTNVLKTTK